MTAHISNPGRGLVFEAFEATLAELYGRSEVTEVGFRDVWRNYLHAIDDLTTNGWYEPPPMGMAVLFAHEDDPARISFESLRLPQYAPGPTKMVWNHGMMYAYCSPVDRNTGLACDFGITLYFGRRSRVRKHFKRAFAATAAVLGELDSQMRSPALLCRSEEIFREAGLQNTIASVTDSTPLDLGHSLPVMPPHELAENRQLTPSQQQRLSESRRFISETAEWVLAHEYQVTIEPQLIALGQSDLPQVSMHYVVAATCERTIVFRECDDLLRRFDLAEV